MLVFPNAKINIGLNITERRSDGYHNLESCFYPIGWSDALEILPQENYVFRSSGIPVPGDLNANLCTKAYQLIAADYEIPKVDMHLLKAVPIGAGLGGGSSDAAFTIKALNTLFDLKISVEKQIEYARRLGSDCAFFILNEPAYCYNKGDEFEKIDLKLKDKWIVLANPGLHISTAEAYSGIEPQQSGQDLRIELQKPIDSWKNSVKNDFEATLFKKYSLLGEIKEKFYTLGAQYAAMSGSGSTVYGIFDKELNLSNQFADCRLWQGWMG